MPDFVARALDEDGLRAAYDARPAYQQNDYLMWINAAKRDDAKRRRLAKMIAELRVGRGYMGMAWGPSHRGSAPHGIRAHLMRIASGGPGGAAFSSA